QRRRDVAEVLARLARELTASLEVERIAALLARGILELVNVQRAAVLRYEPDDSTLRVIAVAGVAAEAATDFVLRSGEGVAGRAIAERKIVMSPDILADPAIELSAELRERTAAHGFRGAAGIPLLTHERLIGALTLWLEPGRLLSPDELQALEALALNEVIERTLSLRLNQLTLSGISVERDLASGLPAIVGDPNQLEQVFLNLLLNSEQAIQDSKRGARIVVRTSTSEGGRAVKA